MDNEVQPPRSPMSPAIKSEHDDLAFFGGLIILIVIALLVIGFSAIHHAKTMKNEKPNQAEVQKEITKAVGESWSDGVMWGALAMKNLLDNKISTPDFGTLINKAQSLKVQFISEQNAKQEGAKVGTNGQGR